MMSTEQCFPDCADDLSISHRCLEESEQYFAQVIGCIEDILMNDNFLNLHNAFMEEYWRDFEDSEENKLIYTDIFKKYTETIEKFIEAELQCMIPHFNMGEFELILSKRPNDMDAEIFHILSSFSNFISFKEKFLDYKAMKEGKTIDFSKDFNVVQYKIQNS